jgi:hypothetical protein
MLPNPVPVYVVNLKSRTDRKAHIMQQFRDRPEFDLHLVEAFQHTCGAKGLWNTIVHILQELADEQSPFIVLCEDDHVFTESYSYHRLLAAIEAAEQQQADILCGGISWFDNAIETVPGLYRVENFSGLQFTVLFRRFFKKIVEAVFTETDAADYTISSLSDHKLFLHPFISIQEEFGYSDVTATNSAPGTVAALFERTGACIRLMEKVRNHYNDPSRQPGKVDIAQFDAVTIPVYVLDRSRRQENLSQLSREFEGKTEFSLTIIPASTGDDPGLAWYTDLQRIITMAMDNDEDIIILCEDDHVFTKNYSRCFFFRNIIEAWEQGADCLTGGCKAFNYAVPVADSRFWVHLCEGTFVVLYRTIFPKIREASFETGWKPGILPTDITSNKLLLYPFVAGMQRPGSTQLNSELLFQQAEEKLGRMKDIQRRYQPEKKYLT